MRITQIDSFGFNDVDDKVIGAVEKVKQVISSAPFNVTSLGIPSAKRNLISYFRAEGFATSIRPDPAMRWSVHAMSTSRLIVHLAFGNVANAMYELMKCEHYFRNSFSMATVFVIPERALARELGSNIADFEKIEREFDTSFVNVLRMPLTLIGIGDTDDTPVVD